ncbi:TonB-dependent receptor [Hymenobacter sp. BT683]|uniref:TonB-dependent receptor n=1 Tax=Hymenobacter jeongseonensis TaxID=2791027 RepID=A0ABS0IFV3_9BACT|nr:TonB-dependent receptor [Hymenobacter jeongseonensis]MBF9237205.1 TonB-dependent receptor [Hymenobacter jeongseonensis]
MHFSYSLKSTSIRRVGLNVRAVVLLAFTACLTSFAGHAQTAAVTGSVRSGAGAPIEFATVTLHRAADSSVVKTEFSDAQGAFRLEQAAGGRYRVSASQVGFVRFWSDAFELPAAGLALPAFALQTSAATALKEVTVVGQKPLFERLADRTVVNVEGSTLAAGNTSLDVLARSPGVTVDGSDNLSLKGRSGLLVLIDGKRQPMTGTQLADYLRALPADQLKSIELITNPPAKYDAQGGAGIIAINLKKDQRLGTNGSVNASLGRSDYTKFTTGLTLNHRREKVNLFSSVTYAKREFFSERNTFRYFYETRDGQPVLRGTSDQRNSTVSTSHFIYSRGGADFTLSKNTVLGGVVTLFSVPNPGPSSRGLNTSVFYDANGRIEDSYTALSTSLGYDPNFSGNVNFKHTFGEGTGSPELTADVDYAQYNNHRTQSQTTFFEPNEAFNTLASDQTSQLRIQAVKADYTQSLNEKTRFEAGAKASLVTADNDIRFENTRLGVTTLDRNLSNRFKYDEFISAAYVNLNHTRGKLNVQGGLRGEQTHAKGQQVTTNEGFVRDYYQLFPSAALKYTLSERHETSLSLSRRINRPGYNQLNPFRFIIDPATSGKGNPDLRPETSLNTEANYTYKQKYTLGLSYSRTDSPITDVAYPETDSTTVSTNVNLDLQHYVALTLTAPFTAGKWLNVYNNAILYYIHYQGNLAGTSLRAGKPTLNFSSNWTATLGKGWGAELNGRYTSAQRVGFFEFKPMGQVGLGIKKDLWDRKGTVRLAVTDIFYTAPLRAVSEYTNYRQDLYLRRDSRVATLSFNWRFGNDKATASPTRRTGAEEERRRAQ